MCLSCARLLDDIQDSSIIESAIPYENEPSSPERAAPKPALTADGSKADLVELVPHDEAIR